ncbi:MAG: hypothetical protein KBC41_00540 [Candidatus Pacebacteria bacterium]|nr:hypothetical protein [Candidatus Paceibacterota bacterium]MBP9866552.1 hypothetical protein [Candidatus Paceibacterota bacterium]
MSEDTIINGPSKSDLFTEFPLPVNRKKRLIFHVVPKNGNHSIEVHGLVMSMEMEDGSGESWNISGYTGNNKRFKAYYRTNRRTGVYQIID